MNKFNALDDSLINNNFKKFYVLNKNSKHANIYNKKIFNIKNEIKRDTEYLDEN